jgi:uncharacterized RDD family membrane protein YckC
MAANVEPGWHRDPAEPETQRYWDGEQWVGDSLPVEATPPPGPLMTAPPAPPAPPSTPIVIGGQGYGQPSRPQQKPDLAKTATQVTEPAAPTTPAQPPANAPPTDDGELPDGRVLAPLGDRLLAKLIDILAVLGLNIAVNGYLVYLLLQELWPAIGEAMAAAQRGQDINPETTPRADNLRLAILVLAIALWFAYEVPAIANNGQTLGKRLAKIKVTKLDGAQVGFGESLRRWLLPGLATALFPIGAVLQVIDALWCTWDRPYRRCIHDKGVGTVVVRAEAATTPTGATTSSTDGGPP